MADVGSLEQGSVVTSSRNSGSRGSNGSRRSQGGRASKVSVSPAKDLTQTIPYEDAITTKREQTDFVNQSAAPAEGVETDFLGNVTRTSVAPGGRSSRGSNRTAGGLSMGSLRESPAPSQHSRSSSRNSQSSQQTSYTQQSAAAARASAGAPVPTDNGLKPGGGRKKWEPPNADNRLTLAERQGDFHPVDSLYDHQPKEEDYMGKAPEWQPTGGHCESIRGMRPDITPIANIKNYKFRDIKGRGYYVVPKSVKPLTSYFDG